MPIGVTDDLTDCQNLKLACERGLYPGSDTDHPNGSVHIPSERARLWTEQIDKFGARKHTIPMEQHGTVAENTDGV